PYQQGARVAELGPGLDHLRESQLRALRRMECHEEGTERAAGNDSDSRPEEVASEADTQDTHGESGKVPIAREPHGPQMPDLPVPLRNGHIVDRTFFDECAGH